ncbi:hypothetical protein Cfor_04772 [Coptotermes formosanus]|uniref:Cytochrome P450 n=1 Tax=Coptotermes formosanus TaxID=36987 RepID=A0A6L2PNM7_COPFO|nr:hypothetical protein Cfor_04772 [Coptotermes formosanus]
MALLDCTWCCSDWALLMLIAAVVLYFIGTSNHNHFSKQNVPFIKPVPFVGCLGPALLRRQHFPHIIMDAYNKLEGHPYGGIFLFKQPFIMPRDPELIKTIAVKDFEYFTDHRAVFPEDCEPVWSRGLFSLRGKDLCVVCTHPGDGPVAASKMLVLADYPTRPPSVSESCHICSIFSEKIKRNM